MAELKPSVGRIVHYVYAGREECAAAVVVAVPEPETASDVSVAAFIPEGVVYYHSVPADFSDHPRGATWHWPRAGLAPDAH